MFIDIHELELHKINFDQTLRPGQIDYGPGVTQVEPLKIRGSAELLETEIHLQGSLRTEVELTCDRCLEPMRHKSELDFDLFYRPVATIAKNEEVEISKDELDIGFYEGNGLALEETAKEQILLALPMKNVCRPDCAGLCPQCGKNRNLGDCGCQPAVQDPRWSTLQELKREVPANREGGGRKSGAKSQNAK